MDILPVGTKAVYFDKEFTIGNNEVCEVIGYWRHAGLTSIDPRDFNHEVPYPYHVRFLTGEVEGDYKYASRSNLTVTQWVLE